jgi:hypothetical protein
LQADRIDSESTIAAGTLTVSGTADLGGDVTTAGEQTYGDTVTLTASVQLLGSDTDADGEAIDFGGPVLGGGNSLTIVGGAGFADAVSGVNALQADRIDSESTIAAGTLTVSGTADLGGDVTTAGEQFYGDTVTLTASVRLQGTNLIFQETVDGDGNGPWDLFAVSTSNGTTTFGGPVGAIHALNSLTTNDDGVTEIHGGWIITLNDQLYRDAIVLGADTTLSAGSDVTFASTVDAKDAGVQRLTVNVDGSVAIRGPMGGQGGLSALVLNVAGEASQTAGIRASNLTLLGTGRFTLTNTQNSFEVLAAQTAGSIDLFESDGLIIGAIDSVTGIENTNSQGGDVVVTAAGELSVQQPVRNAGGGDTVLTAGGASLQIDAPVANSSGNGNVELSSSGDLVISNTASSVDIQADGGRIIGRAGGDVFFSVGTVIQTGTGFIEVTAGTIDPAVILVPVDQGGANVDAAGNALIEVSVTAPAGQNFEILVDWSDGTIDRYLLPQQAPFDGSQIYTFRHTYTGPPDPINPAAPIPVQVTVAFDGRLPAGSGEADNGIVFYRASDHFIDATVADTLTVPGEGVFGFIIIVESEIEVIELRRTQADVLLANQTVVIGQQSNPLEAQAVELDVQASSTARLFLRRVDSSGKESDDIQLDIAMLEAGLLPALSRLPNGRYRVYYQEQNSERIRMVQEVNVYQGRVVPQDFRSDTSERQPGGLPPTQQQTPADDDPDRQQPPEESMPDEDAPAEAADQDAGASPSPGLQAAADSPTAMVIAATAAMSWERARRSRWADQVDQAYAAGGRSRGKWNRLRKRQSGEQAEPMPKPDTL